MKAVVNEGVACDDETTGTVWQLLRSAQRTTGCTNKTLATIETILRPIMLKSGQGKKDDRMLLEKANAVLLQLHGCVGCDDFVFLPSDVRIRCPRCRHPRFNYEKKPNEVCWYFPLENQIKQLLKNKNYQYQLKHEGRRTQHHDYMSDVYDSPRWQHVAGNMTGDRVTRIVLQFCVDAFPWSSRKHQVRTSILNHDLNPNFQRSNLCYVRAR